MVSNIRKKAVNESICFQYTENKIPLAEIKDLFKNKFPLNSKKKCFLRQESLKKYIKNGLY